MKWGGIGCGSLLVLFIIVAIIGGATAQESDSQVVSTPTPIPTPTLTFDELVGRAIRVNYDELFRNNEQYIGETVYFRGEVIQVIDVTDGTAGNWVLRVNVTESDNFWSDAVFVHYSGPRLLENDLIEMIGVVDGLKTYGAVLSNEVTIPEITTSHIRLVAKASER